MLEADLTIDAYISKYAR